MTESADSAELDTRFVTLPSTVWAKLEAIKDGMAHPDMGKTFEVLTTIGLSAMTVTSKDQRRFMISSLDRRAELGVTL